MEITKALERFRRKNKDKLEDTLFYVLDDLERGFTQAMLLEIMHLHNSGYGLGNISKALNRDGDEIFLALLQLSRMDKIKRPINFKRSKAYEIKELKRKKGMPTLFEIDGMKYAYVSNSKNRR